MTDRNRDSLQVHWEWGGDGDSNHGNRMGTVSLGTGIGIKFLQLWGWGGDGDSNHVDGVGMETKDVPV